MSHCPELLGERTKGPEVCHAHGQQAHRDVVRHFELPTSSSEGATDCHLSRGFKVSDGLFTKPAGSHDHGKPGKFVEFCKIVPGIPGSLFSADCARCFETPFVI